MAHSHCKGASVCKEDCPIIPAVFGNLWLARKLKHLEDIIIHNDLDFIGLQNSVGKLLLGYVNILMRMIKSPPIVEF